LDDKSRRKILGTAPFNGLRTVLHRRAKLRFHLGDAISDRCLTLIKQLLGRLARREIERRTEFACGNSNDMGAEPLRELPGNLQPDRSSARLTITVAYVIELSPPDDSPKPFWIETRSEG
jgi:hypothetical protein